MANLPETATFDAGVYQLELLDPVQGGASGVSNAPLKNLANRTAYLKQHLDAIEDGLFSIPGYAKLASPAFTGDPTAPTAALGDNDTSIANTAFVQATVGGRLVKSVAGGANVALTAVEAGNGILEFTGALTANIAVIVPTSPTRPWLIKNATSGAYTLTIKTAAGTGVAVSQGKQSVVYTDGNNVLLAFNDFNFSLYAPLASPGLTGNPTAPTPPQFDNDTSIANTAFVQRALGNYSSHFFVNTTQSIASAYAGNLIIISANAATPITLTMPSAALLGDGATFEIFNYNQYSHTVNFYGAESCNAFNNSTYNFTLNPGDSIKLTAVNQSVWDLTGGTVALRYAQNFALTGNPTAPTPAQFDNDTSLATTEFVQRALGNQAGRVLVTSSGALAVADAGKRHNITAANLTLSLPLLSQVPLGAVYWIRCSAGPATIQTQGSDSMTMGTTSQTSVNLQSGEFAIFVAGGTEWNMEGGDKQLMFSPRFLYSLAANGSQKLPSGLIIQWGVVTTSASADVSVTFPTTFPNAVVALTLTPSATGAGYFASHNASSTTGFKAAAWAATSTRVSAATFWIAIGY